MPPSTDLTDLPSAVPTARYRAWLDVLAKVLVLCTFLLVTMGGHVTSTEAGLAVPDWPGTFGHFMLIAPLDTWAYASDTLAEHSHRLMGMVVGLLAIGLAVGLVCSSERHKFVRSLGIVLLIFVIIQGLFGGFRVTEKSQLLAGVHGVLGQLVLGGMVLAATLTGRRWIEAAKQQRRPFAAKLSLIVLVLLIAQLCLGSAVRHSRSALAIPDFPASYGQVMPPMNQEKLDVAVAEFKAGEHVPPAYAPAGGYQAWQVHLHLTHRLGAIAVTLGAGWLFYRVWTRFRGERRVLWPGLIMAGLLILQITLGVCTVWTGEHHSVATGHQTIGAALLASAVWLAIRLHRIPIPAERNKLAPIAAGEATTDRFQSQPAGN